MAYSIPYASKAPLAVDEVMNCLRFRWQATYDLRLVVRQNQLYLNVMWAYLEQQSFPLTETEYRIHLNDVLEIINRLGLSQVVREWLSNADQKPRVGRPMTLPLRSDFRSNEFIVETAL